MNPLDSKIEAIIYRVRGQSIMLDSDLALLYEVETKALNRQVRRNINRFPKDFCFQLTKNEYENLKCQIGTSSSTHGGRRKQPIVFTELGIAMLSSVLKSERAAMVNIAIMRTFVRLRSFLAMENSLQTQLDEFQKETQALFKIVFERIDNLDEAKIIYKKRKKIGFKDN
jgi:hypothetical protein